MYWILIPIGIYEAKLSITTRGHTATNQIQLFWLESDMEAGERSEPNKRATTENQLTMSPRIQNTLR